jgi:hypothetical protein
VAIASKLGPAAFKCESLSKIPDAGASVRFSSGNGV